jgi:hypothetical protein
MPCEQVSALEEESVFVILGDGEGAQGLRVRLGPKFVV